MQTIAFSPATNLWRKPMTFLKSFSISLAAGACALAMTAGSQAMDMAGHMALKTNFGSRDRITSQIRQQ